MRTHPAMSPPGGYHGVDPHQFGWQPEHPSAPQHPASTGPAHHPAAAPHPVPPADFPGHLPPGYGAASAPGGYRRPPETTSAAHPAAPAPPSAQWTDADDDPPEAHRWAYLRRQVAVRCKRANTGHVVEADQRFGQRDALGPHAVLIFFTSGAPAEPHGCRLHTAHRLFLSSPESDDLPRLLADLTKVAEHNVVRAASAGRRWHPLGPDGSMVNGGDMTLPDGAVYLGVGVSTLDSDQGRWYQVARSLRDVSASGRYLSAFDLKGRCYALLTDGSALHIDRDPHARLGDDGIRCNKTLDPDRITHYNPHTHLTEEGDDATRDVWRQLTALHHTLTAHMVAGRAA